MNMIRRVVLVVLAVTLCVATGAEAKGKKDRGKKAARAGGAAITSTITVEGKEYQVRLIPLGDGAKAGKAAKKDKGRKAPTPVVVLDGTKYLVKIVDPANPKAAREGKRAKGAKKAGKADKAGKGKKRGKKKKL